MAFNPELSFKALDSRVNGIDRTLESFQKEFRASGLKGLEDRIGKLEAVVKAMAEAKMSDKVSAMDKTVKALENAKLVDEFTLKKLMAEAYRKQGEEYTKETNAIVAKTTADAIKSMEVTKMEVRLNLFEARVASLGR